MSRRSTAVNHYDVYSVDQVDNSGASSLTQQTSYQQNRRLRGRRKLRDKNSQGNNRNDGGVSTGAIIQWVVFSILAFCLSFEITSYLREFLQTTNVNKKNKYRFGALRRWYGTRSSSTLEKRMNDTNPRLIMTNLGWNHPNPSTGLKFGRTLFSSELFRDGITQHGWYDSDTTIWTRQQHPDDPFTYIFLDVETCYEQIWPHYGSGLTRNSDGSNGRQRISSSGGILRRIQEQTCPYVQHVLDNSPLLQVNTIDKAKSRAQLVLLDCGYHGPTEQTCLSRFVQHDHGVDHRVALVSLSATRNQHWPEYDIGLPPPAITPSHLKASQVERIMLPCTSSAASNNLTEVTSDRPYLLSFMGNFRHPVRQILRSLNDNRTILIRPRFTTNAGHDGMNEGDMHSESMFNIETTIERESSLYKSVLQQSQFAAVPRGDYLYTYRLLEVMSAGAIPVIFADNWVLPFHSSVIDWDTVSVRIPQSNAHLSLEYLFNISLYERCQMRKRGYQLYQNYLATALGTVQGIIESLEYLRFQREGTEQTNKFL